LSECLQQCAVIELADDAWPDALLIEPLHEPRAHRHIRPRQQERCVVDGRPEVPRQAGSQPWGGEYRQAAFAEKVEGVDHIDRFRELTPAQRGMLLAARKEPGKYTEGAILGAHFQTLLRIIPPSLALALSMTEPEEKAERARIMREKHATALDAAYEMAARLAEGAS